VAFLERLAEHLKYVSCELRKFVEEKHPVVS
jgi:hypothetical protein